MRDAADAPPPCCLFAPGPSLEFGSFGLTPHDRMTRTCPEALFTPHLLGVRSSFTSSKYSFSLWWQGERSPTVDGQAIDAKVPRQKHVDIHSSARPRTALCLEGSAKVGSASKQVCFASKASRDASSLLQSTSLVAGRAADWSTGAKAETLALSWLHACQRINGPLWPLAYWRACGQKPVNKVEAACVPAYGWGTGRHASGSSRTDRTDSRTVVRP